MPPGAPVTPEACFQHDDALSLPLIAAPGRAFALGSSLRALRFTMDVSRRLASKASRADRAAARPARSREAAIGGVSATRRSSFRFKTDQIADDGTFSGYGSVFGVVDSYGDIVLPGAFEASLAAHAAAGDMPKLLWQHLPEEPIGVWLEMREDAQGLYARGKLLTEVRRGAEALALLRAGALSGLSIGYEAITSSNASAQEVREAYGYDVPDGGTYRLLHEVDLWELSVVTFPALAVAQVDSVKTPPAPRPRPPAPAAAAALDFEAIAAALLRRGRLLSSLR